MQTRLLQSLCLSFIFWLSLSSRLVSQSVYGKKSQSISGDTISLAQSDIESAFLSKNLLLLAQKYSIDAAKAQVLQAKLWNNPGINYEINPYNQYTHRAFDLSSKGESLASINQLFSLAGKRNKKIALEKVNAEIAEFQFFDLLRTLKYQLRTSFYDLYFFEQNAKLCDTEISSYQKLINQDNIQLQKGNVSLKENVRLKAELFELQNEKLAILDSINTNQSVLKILINDTTGKYIQPVLDTNLFFRNRQKIYSIDELQKMAVENRYDLKIYQNQIKWNEANISLQKSMAMPDINLFADYDHQSDYIIDYFGLGFSIDLPLFNRNQGNIRSSKSQLEQSRLQYENYYLQLINNVFLTYSRTIKSQDLSDKFDSKFTSDLKKTFDSMLENYEKRSVSMLEFIDFFTSYKQTMMNVNHLKNNLLNYYEEVNFITGSDLFNK